MRIIIIPLKLYTIKSQTSTEIDPLPSESDNSNHLNASVLSVAFHLVIRHKNSCL